jgi:hypothetical protein
VISFPDVPVRTDTATCAVCRNLFVARDRIVIVKIVAGVGPHPRTGRRVIYLSDDDNSERAHVACVGARKKPMIERPCDPGVRDTDTRCGGCDAAYRRGDRVMPVYVVLAVRKDPETGRMSSECAEEHEHYHARCDDPQLVNGRILL